MRGAPAPGSEEEYEEVLGPEPPTSSVALSWKPRLPPKPKRGPMRDRPPGVASTSVPTPPQVKAASPPRGQAWQDGDVFRPPKPSIWFEDYCQSQPEPLPGGRPRAWRIGTIARMLKRPWSRHWRLIFQSCHAVWHRWQSGEPQSADTYFWLANAYRLVYNRSLWPRIQTHLIGLERFESCRRTCELIRSHRRADLHPSITVTKYTACSTLWTLQSVVTNMSFLSLTAIPHAALLVLHRPCDTLTHHAPRGPGSRLQTGVEASVVSKALHTFRFERPACCVSALTTIFLSRSDTHTGLLATLAGSHDPRKLPPPASRNHPADSFAEGWPHVLLRTDEAHTTIRSLRQNSASASPKCFICRYDDDSKPPSRRRTRPPSITARTSPCTCDLVPLATESGLCQTTRPGLLAPSGCCASPFTRSGSRTRRRFLAWSPFPRLCPVGALLSALAVHQ